MGSHQHPSSPPGSYPVSPEQSTQQQQQQQQYCLKWNNHQSNLLKVFNRLLGSEQFTDVLLAAEGKTLRGHKVVLSACSSYFEELFTSFNERNQIVILKDTKFSDLSAIIEFMYKGEISVIQDQLSSLLKTAENLKVKGLAEVSGDEKSGSAKSSSSSSVHSSPTSPSPPQITTTANNSSNRISTQNSSSSSSSAGATPAKNSYILNSINRRSNSPKEHHHIAPPPLHTLNPLHIHLGTRQLSPPPAPLPKKRGRPRLSESRGDLSSSKSAYRRKAESLSHHHHHAKVQHPPLYPSDPVVDEETEALLKAEELSYINEDGAPTPGGPLTLERIQDLGVVKMNDYLMSGTRQQFWDEYFIKVVMQGVRNKEIDMKSAAEILGVSYGTLYGRYRETFGYLKHAWNVGGRPPKIPSSSSPGAKDLGLMTMWTDPQNEDILEQLKQGRLTIKQAADMLGMEPSVLDYHLTGKTGGKLYHHSSHLDDEDELMEVQPDIILRHEETDPIEIEED